MDHLIQGISPGNILTIIALFVSVMLAWNKLDKRITITENLSNQLKDLIENESNSIQSNSAVILELRMQTQKLTLILERQEKHMGIIEEHLLIKLKHPHEIEPESL